MSKSIWVFNNGFTEQPVKDEDPKEDGWIQYVEFSKYEKLEQENKKLRDYANEYIEWADEREHHIETMLFREMLGVK